jgi:hypothetical protein
MMRVKGESKYREDDIKALEARMALTIDFFAQSPNPGDTKQIKQFALMAVEARVAEGYDADSIVQSWEMAGEMFTRLLNETLADDPNLAEYIHWVNLILKTAKLAVAEHAITLMRAKTS